MVKRLSAVVWTAPGGPLFGQGTVAGAAAAEQLGSADPALGGFDRASDVDPGVGVELAEHVADVRFDGLLAEKQLSGDLGIGLAVHDQIGDLELATGQRAYAAV